jgi:hypothetical protein
MNELFAAPSHVLPSLSALYKPFMESLLLKKEIPELSSASEHRDVQEADGNPTQQQDQV